MLFDTHTHLNFKAFEESYREAIQESLARGVLLTNVGSQYQTSLRAVEIAHEFEHAPVFATVGLHPVHVANGENVQELNYEQYKALAQDQKVIAIGECGIDYFRLPSEQSARSEVMKKQEEVFQAHIRLARELHKPLMVHCRPSKENPHDAYSKVIEILSPAVGAFRGTPLCDVPLRGVIHCFVGGQETAREFLKLGFFISFTGIITFKNSGLAPVVLEVPLEKMLIETDAPYLAPEPFRGKTNYPYYVEYVARKIAEIKGLEYEEVAEVTTKNARELFKIM